MVRLFMVLSAAVWRGCFFLLQTDGRTAARFSVSPNGFCSYTPTLRCQLRLEDDSSKMWLDIKGQMSGWCPTAAARLALDKVLLIDGGGRGGREGHRNPCNHDHR